MTAPASSGRYRTRRIPAGNTSSASSLAAATQGNWLAQIYKSNAKPTPVRVRAGKTTAGINAALRLGGEISGTVIDANGRSSAASAYPGQHQADIGRRLTAHRRLGASQGVYTCTACPPGPTRSLFQAAPQTSPYAPGLVA